MIYSQILQNAQEGKKMFAVLVDPDKYNDNALLDLVNLARKSEVHFFFVGGSLMTSDRFEKTIEVIRQTSDIPVVIFPGSNAQISSKADGILLLSLISGRNPEYLIGQHVVAAPYLKKAGIEVISTGYMLIEGNNTTTANYMSNSLPIPADKADIAACTAMAGEMLGMKLIYLDGGSGAEKSISEKLISGVRDEVDIPVIVGGWIIDAQGALSAWNAGADLVVVGNGIEKDLSLLSDISAELKSIG